MLEPTRLRIVFLMIGIGMRLLQLLDRPVPSTARRPEASRKMS